MSYKDLVNDLLDVREQAQEIREMFRTAFPSEWERLRVLEEEIPRIQSQLTVALREVGSTVTVEGFRFQVQQVEKTVVAVPDVLDRAKEENDMADLLEYGFLYYEVNPDQLTRLPDRLQGRYKDLIKKEKSTPRVTLPKELK
jgi:hypothetical protein